MKIAVTGGTGFVGSNLAGLLAAKGHEVKILGRSAGSTGGVGVSKVPLVIPVKAGVNDSGILRDVFADCDAVAHCAGINREIGSQTYRDVHVEGTRNVVEAAKRAGVKKVALVSFLRARPNCGSKYHESKWAAEEIVRSSGLDYTIFKAGVIYGKGDHMLDHLSRAFYTFPLFGLVGFREQSIRPMAVEDMVRAMAASLTDGRLPCETVAITGPEELTLSEAVKRVAQVVGRSPLYVRLPVTFHYGLGWCLERVMKVPLVSLAQVRILSEGLVEPVGPCDQLPEDLRPRIPFNDEQIRNGLPEPGPFGWHDFLWA